MSQQKLLWQRLLLQHVGVGHDGTRCDDAPELAQDETVWLRVLGFGLRCRVCLAVGGLGL